MILMGNENYYCIHLHQIFGIKYLQSFKILNLK